MRQDRRWQGPRLAIVLVLVLLAIPACIVGYLAAPTEVQKVAITLGALIVGILMVRGRSLLGELLAGGRRDGLIFRLARFNTLLGGALLFGGGVARVAGAVAGVFDAPRRGPTLAAFCGSILLVLGAVAWRVSRRGVRDDERPRQDVVPRTSPVVDQAPDEAQVERRG